MRLGPQPLTSGLVAILLITAFLSTQSPAQTTRSKSTENGQKSNKASGLGETSELKGSESEMRSSIERYTVDRATLTRSYPVAVSAGRRDRFRKFYSDWLASLLKLDFDSMSQDGKIDYLLFKNHLEYELRQLDIQSRQLAEIQPLIPFAKTI